MTVAVRRTPTHTGTVAAVARLTPLMRRISVAGVTLHARPAQDVELILPGADGRRVKRRYTIRNLRADGLDIDAVVHGDPPGGPGARWAATAAPGDEVVLAGPRGRLEVTAADWHLFVGDESALPAIAELVGTVPRAVAVVEVAGSAEEQPVDADLTWVHRGDTPPGTSDLLRAALDGLDVPPGRGHGYLLGETRAMIALRPALERWGLSGAAVDVKGYWNVGRPVSR